MVGTMSVAEAGRKGGLHTSKGHTHDFYKKIGRKGGMRTAELVKKGIESEQKEVKQNE